MQKMNALDRRAILRVAAGLSVAAIGAPLAGCGGGSGAASSATTRATETKAVAARPSPTASAGPDAALLNFALNLQYLAAQFYAHAGAGPALSASTLAGAGAQGEAANGRRLLGAAPAVARYAAEIAGDKAARLNDLRAVLSGAEVGQPALELSAGLAPAADDTSAVLASAVGAATGVFGGDQAFLTGALLFEDVGAAAFRGMLAQLTGASAQAVTADLLADATYHAGLLRSALVAGGSSDAALKRVSDARQALDRVAPPAAGATADGQDIVGAEGYATAFTRSPAQALNVLYLTPVAASAGGFFPRGVNGDIRLAA